MVARISLLCDLCDSAISVLNRLCESARADRGRMPIVALSFAVCVSLHW